MIRGVSGISAYQAVAKPDAVKPAAAAAPGFADTLQRGLGAVEGSQDSAHSALALLASGEQVDLHGTMIELEKADIALRTMVSVRDKFINAYEQVMNMTV